MKGENQKVYIGYKSERMSYWPRKEQLNKYINSNDSSSRGNTQKFNRLLLKKFQRAVKNKFFHGYK